VRRQRAVPRAAPRGLARACPAQPPGWTRAVHRNPRAGWHPGVSLHGSSNGERRRGKPAAPASAPECRHHRELLVHRHHCLRSRSIAPVVLGQSLLHPPCGPPVEPIVESDQARERLLSRPPALPSPRRHRLPFPDSPCRPPVDFVVGPGMRIARGAQDFRGNVYMLAGALPSRERALARDFFKRCASYAALTQLLRNLLRNLLRTTKEPLTPQQAARSLCVERVLRTTCKRGAGTRLGI